MPRCYLFSNFYVCLKAVWDEIEIGVTVVTLDVNMDVSEMGSISPIFYEFLIQILYNYAHFYIDSNDPIRTQFCSCQESVASTVWANGDQHFTYKNNINFHKSCIMCS